MERKSFANVVPACCGELSTCWAITYLNGHKSFHAFRQVTVPTVVLSFYFHLFAGIFCGSFYVPLKVGHAFAFCLCARRQHLNMMEDVF